MSKFGFRKWKSHVTERPLEVRSEVVQQLYKEAETADAGEAYISALSSNTVLILSVAFYEV